MTIVQTSFQFATLAHIIPICNTHRNHCNFNTHAHHSNLQHSHTPFQVATHNSDHSDCACLDACMILYGGSGPTEPARGQSRTGPTVTISEPWDIYHLLHVTIVQIAFRDDRQLYRHHCNLQHSHTSFQFATLTETIAISTLTHTIPICNTHTHHSKLQHTTQIIPMSTLTHLMV